MAKYKELNLNAIKKSKLPLIIGYFGSVHVMHSQLLDKYHRYNILTFKDFKQKAKSQLYTFEERIENISAFKPQNIFVFDINKYNMKAEEFIWQVLLKLQPDSVLVGSDFRFGSDHQRYDIMNKYFPVDTITYNQRVSTSIIANLLARKQVEKANNLLYTPYYYIGKWIKGNHRGRKIGYRTINILIDHKLSVCEGSYVTRITIGRKSHKSVSFVGKSKTFKEQKAFLEVHILDRHIAARSLFPSSIRNKVKVEFLKFIRTNTQYKKTQQLVKAIEKDIKVAKAYFGRHK